jgi:hypothetical protein
MKISRSLLSVLSGFLACLFLAGCFNPIAFAPGGEEEEAAAAYPESFTVEVLVGDDPPARSVAGPASNQITQGGLLNVIQLIVTNDEGALVAFDEVRRPNGGQTAAELWIRKMPFGRTYNFLVLMGHWDRNYTAEEENGDYVYIENRPPTLLAAGFQSELVNASGTIMITMSPIVVDTKFTEHTSGAPVVVQPQVPQAVSLPQVKEWDVTWTIQRGTGGESGLSNLLAAQKSMPNHGGDTSLVFKSLNTLVRQGAENWTSASLKGDKGNVITQSLNGYTSALGSSGSVNFKLAYIPFGLAWPEGVVNNPWAGYNLISAFNLEGGAPEWIIRNGINDAAQTAATSFADGKNGNGAVLFTTAPKTPSQGSTLELKNGSFVGPNTVTEPYINFTTAGYDGTGQVYYAVVAQNVLAPAFSDYTLMNGGSVTQGDHTKTVTIPAVGSIYDVYLILFKEGEVSNGLRISTEGGDVSIVMPWEG